jgi:hypothetical protein
MTDQTKAERLADALQQQAVWEGHYGPSYLRDLLPEAAAELRRLHALNGELLDALKALCESHSRFSGGVWDKARSAIAKAEGSV